MDGKRVSLPVLGLVLALIFVSSQAIYGGQIWDDDMGGGGMADRPDGIHIPLAPPSGPGARVCTARQATPRLSEDSATIDRSSHLVEDRAIGPDLGDVDARPVSWRFATRRDWLQILSLLLGLRI